MVDAGDDRDGGGAAGSDHSGPPAIIALLAVPIVIQSYLIVAISCGEARRG